ncbi:MAG: hypothetical protein ACLP50_15120 [Solirubrobacteraceae bacterium]
MTQPLPGFVSPDVRAEFPDLRLDWLHIPGRARPSPRELVDRLARLSDRVRGASAVTMRARPVPQAFRSFFRQIGLDPDVDRPPGERAAVARLLDGEWRSAGLIEDARLVALVDTGVPVWALDADVLDDRGLGIRTIGDDEPTRSAGHAASGTLAVADGSRVHAVLFGEPLAAAAVGRSTTRVALYAIGVPGVPAIHVEEALWTCVELIGGDSAGC